MSVQENRVGANKPTAQRSTTTLFEAAAEKQMSRRQFLRFMGRTMLGAATLSAGGWTYVSHVEPGWVETVQVSLALHRLPSAFNGFRIVQISDIHMGSSMNGERLSEVVRSIEQIQPDLVVMTGDFFNEMTDLRPAISTLIDILRPLAAQIQTVAVLGNHDYTTSPTAARTMLRESGVSELLNTFTTIQRDSQQLHIAGIDDVAEGFPNLSKLIKHVPNDDTPAVLLVHEPDFADSAALARRFDVQLSGHSHGGQVVVPGVGPIVLPEYARKYPTGLYWVDNLWLYTNRGLGTSQPHVRFHCRPELTVLTLVRG